MTSGLHPARANTAAFFFLSRRRHTRSKRDWSSDVCSSDLVPPLSPTSEIGIGTHLDGSSPLGLDARLGGRQGRHDEEIEKRRQLPACGAVRGPEPQLVEIGRASCREGVYSGGGGGGREGNS